MANMHLVTGFAGYEHVTSADQGLFNSYIFGDLEVVMERGNMFEASIISNNIIRVKDGDLLMQGRFARLNDDSYVDLTIDNGTQGYFRNDLIVARYQKDIVTAVETVDLVVIKGEDAESDPADPAHVKGDIKFGKDFQNDIPLWRVSLDGLNVTGLTCLFSTFGTTVEALKNRLDAHADQHGKDGSDPITLDDLGIGEYVHPASKVSIPDDLAATIGSDANVESALGVVHGLVNGVVTTGDHWWRKDSGGEKFDVVVSPTVANALIGQGVGGTKVQVYYSDTLDVSSGVPKLVNPTSLQVDPAATASPTTANQLNGKYWVIAGQINVSTGAITGTYAYYSSSDAATATQERASNGSQWVYSLYKPAQTIMFVEDYAFEAVQSSNRNEYPDDGEQDGANYHYLGRTDEVLAANKVSVQKGMYSGTGTYNTANPNSLVFDFVPKIVMISQHNGTNLAIFNAAQLTSTGQSYGYAVGGALLQYCVAKLNKNVLEWYCNSAAQQMNVAGTTYYWVAIG